ncbi:MgtC/SapB family protein [Phocaeicola sp.]
MLLLSDFLLRIASAFFAGTAIGIERQYRQRNAGLRTNVLVSVGAAAFTVLSYSMTSGNGDPSRVAAQIVSGIGFLGGGLILKDGFHVRGLNTAATIWCSAACGTLSGVGMYVESFILVACVLITHCLFRPLCRLLERKVSGISEYTVRVECKLELSDKVRQLITDVLAQDEDVKMNSLYYKEESDDLITVLCEIEITGDHTVLLDLIVSRLRAQYGVVNAGWEKNTAMHEVF